MFSWLFTITPNNFVICYCYLPKFPKDFNIFLSFWVEKNFGNNQMTHHNYWLGNWKLQSNHYKRRLCNYTKTLLIRALCWEATTKINLHTFHLFLVHILCSLSFPNINKNVYKSILPKLKKPCNIMWSVFSYLSLSISNTRYLIFTANLFKIWQCFLLAWNSISLLNHFSGLKCLSHLHFHKTYVNVSFCFLAKYIFLPGISYIHVCLLASPNPHKLE